ncbi:hypothetical protein F5144DRAFT_233682 [Chaetomium tenue]|uniref:Uncharacterized protein n=1 Tax=Chaetomium tenue TaxID=1854479 RepID=A0ACB7PBC4_9PEZI|nr:hypothetical protein F5144DRAFT_233682 [Chaetomium globosum]
MATDRRAVLVEGTDELGIDCGYSWCWDWGTNSGYIVPTTTQSVPATRNTTTVRPWPAIIRVVPRLLPCSTVVSPCRAVAWVRCRRNRFWRILENLGAQTAPGVVVIRTDFGEKSTPGSWLGARGAGHGIRGMGTRPYEVVECPQGPGYDRRRKQDPEMTRVWEACGTDCRLRQLQQATDGTGHRPNVSSDGASICWETRDGKEMGRKATGHIKVVIFRYRRQRLVLFP